MSVQAAGGPTDPYVIKITRALAKKLHDAGKLNMLLVVEPLQGGRQNVTDSIEFLSNDVPYCIDTTCLAYGMADIRRATEPLVAKAASKGTSKKSRVSAAHAVKKMRTSTCAVRDTSWWRVIIGRHTGGAKLT